MIIKTVESVESRFSLSNGRVEVGWWWYMHNIRSDQINSYRDRDGLVLMSRSSTHTDTAGKILDWVQLIGCPNLATWYKPSFSSKSLCSF